MSRKRPFYHLLLLCLFALSHPLQAQEPELELWHSQQAGYVIDDVIARFNQEGNHRVRVTQIEPGKIKADLLLAAQARGLPDLMLIPSDFIGLYRQMTLAPLPAEWFSPALMASALRYVTLDRQRWGMPMMQGNHLMLFYNKALVSTPVTQWQQLTAITPALKAKGVYPVSWPYHDMYYFAAFLHTFGGSPVTEGRITLDSPAMVQALEAYRTVASEQWVDPECDYDTALARFNEGKSAYLINGDWAFNDLVKNMGDKLGVALLPRWQSHPMHSMSGAYVMGASRWAMDDGR
ncbi:MAG: sugar ABC transporter substrate-binding protein [Aeromonas veronii]